jgi:hypothetical protein
MTVTLLAPVLISCSEEKEVKPFTYTKVFTGENSKTWVIEEVVVKKIGQADQEIELESCEKDDRYTFNADEEKSFVITNGNNKCDPAEEDEYVRDTWSFVNAGSAMNFAVPRIFGFYIIPFIVKEVNDSSLVVEVYADLENTISYQITFKAVDEN